MTEYDSSAFAEYKSWLLLEPLVEMEPMVEAADRVSCEADSRGIAYTGRHKTRPRGRGTSIGQVAGRYSRL